jgi:hypothetical protein
MNSTTRTTTNTHASIGRTSMGRKFIWLFLTAGLVLAAGLALAGTASAQDRSWLPWGKPKNGLSMAVYPVSPRDRGTPGIRFNVALRNTGKTDLDVNLGTSLDNGKTQYPDKIVLILNDEERARTLAFREPKWAANGTSPLIVRIAAGGKYSFSVNLDDYWFPPSGKFDTRLKPGYYYAIEARFTGEATAQPVGASDSNGGAPATFWAGSIKSKRLRFTVGPAYAYGYYPRPRYVRYWPYGPYPYPPPYGSPYPPPPPPPPPPARDQQQQDRQQQQDQSQEQDQQQQQDQQQPQQ